jgi:hypothetical protein
MSTAQWQWITQARNGAQIADVTGLANRRMLFQENQPGMVSAGLRVNDMRARRDDLGGLAPGQHELKVYRNGEPIETVFQMTDVNVSGNANTMSLAFEWAGIASYLQDALVLPQATMFSSTTLPWTWINTFQSRTGGSYGITQGTVSGTAPNRQKLVSSETGLLAAINDLAGTGDGFSWAIDTNRAYREWHSTRGADNGIVLEPGVNVLDWSFGESTKPGELVSDLFVNGPPGTQQVTASDSTTRTLYGRREAAVTMFSDVEASSVTDGQLKANADAGIASRVTPMIIPQIKLKSGHQSIPWGSYWLGDIVTFRVRIGNYDWINQPYRIVQIEVSLDANNNEAITLGVNGL